MFQYLILGVLVMRSRNEVKTLSLDLLLFYSVERFEISHYNTRHYYAQSFSLDFSISSHATQKKGPTPCDWIVLYNALLCLLCYSKVRREYVDEEAELSGSEAGSDEDVDLDERDDILEMEAGDKDDVGTEDQLREEVGKVHLWVIVPKLVISRFLQYENIFLWIKNVSENFLYSEKYY